MSLAPAFLDDLRSRAGLTSLIGRRVKLQKAGREWKGCCPFHNEKTPSFYVNEDKGFYHCFGCGAHGDAIGFLMADGGMSFMEAVHALAAETGLTVPVTPRDAQEEERRKGLAGAVEDAADWFRKQLDGVGGAEARAYLGGRGVTAELAAAFGLGFAPDGRDGLRRGVKRPADELVRAGLLIQPEDGREAYDRFRGRLMFPIHDMRGRPVGFGGRVMGDAQPKYLNSPDSALFDKGRLLYNFHRAAPAARKSGRLLLVEGYMDVIGLAGAGVAEAVAPLGTAVTEEQLALAWRLVDAPVVMLDGDRAGQAAAMRLALRALPQLIPGKWLAFATLPAGEDPDDLAKRGGAAAVEALVAGAVPLSRFVFAQEAAAADLRSAEGRVALQQRLDDHARRIVNPLVRSEYAREWKRAGFELYSQANAANFARRTDARGAVARAAAGLRPESRANQRPNIIGVQAGVLARLIGLPDAVDAHVEALYRVEWRTGELAGARDALVSGDVPDARWLAGAAPLFRGWDAGRVAARIGDALAALAEFDHIKAERAASRKLHDSAPEDAFQMQERTARAQRRMHDYWQARTDEWASEDAAV